MLGFAHLQMWASGWAQGICDIDTPPNHNLFKTKNNGAQLAPPTLLQRRAAANQPVAPAAPVINNNFSFPDALLEIFRPANAIAPAAPPPASIVSSNAADESMLIPRNAKVGEPMPISTFCTIYDLDSSIEDRFKANGYKKVSSFSYIKLSDLVAMEFLPGEIAELRDAVCQWVVPG
ncbi:hypothetical protein B0H11DRAFT_2227258 [Mycena galericulata]|nr:hypothetical protein B0H11DRAFT_2227258 [Mycena galericulata]